MGVMGAGPEPGSLVYDMQGNEIGRTIANPGPEMSTFNSTIEWLTSRSRRGAKSTMELIGATGLGNFLMGIESRYGQEVAPRRRATHAQAIDDLLACWHHWGTLAERKKVYMAASTAVAQFVADEAKSPQLVHIDANEDKGEDRYAELLHAHAPAVRPHWVAPWVCDLLAESAHTFPNAPLRREDVPGPVGFVRFADPLPIADPVTESGLEAPGFGLRAIFWCAGKLTGTEDDEALLERIKREGDINAVPEYLSGGTPIPTALPEAESLFVLAFRHQERRILPGDLADLPLLVANTQFLIGEDADGYARIVAQSIADCDRLAGRDALQKKYYVARRKQLIVEAIRSRQIHRYLDMLFAFMREKIAPPVATPIEHRGQAREYRRRGLHEALVRVVHLREIERKVQEAEAEAGRGGWKLTERHWVKGHWKRVHTKEGTRRAYVMPYIRGPEDSPLREPTWVINKVAR